MEDKTHNLWNTYQSWSLSDLPGFWRSETESVHLRPYKSKIVYLD